MNGSRRSFIEKAGLGGMAMLGLPLLPRAEDNLFQQPGGPGNKSLTILFQGDSITDGNRGRNNDWNHLMGHGYAFLVASRLWYNYPGRKLMFYNRGNSGDRVRDLESRWQEDAINLKPDIVSLLVGINDVIGSFDNRQTQNIETFEGTYRRLLDKTRAALPAAYIIICEPFILPVGMVLEKQTQWESLVSKRQEVTKRLAKDYQATFVELQKPFNDACKKAPASYWIWDGIHPMPAGHELIARQWLKKAKSIMPFLHEETT